MESIRLATFDVDTLRTGLRKMSDEELREFGKAARLVSPTANMGKPLPAVDPLQCACSGKPKHFRVNSWRSDREIETPLGGFAQGLGL
jgi:hypothetical protein